MQLRLGNLNARRDWGFAGDYVRGMHLMLQQAIPRDYVLATGVTHSVRDLCEIAFGHVGLDYRDYVVSEVDTDRAPECMQLVGDASRAKDVLRWAPTVSFRALVEMMVDADMDRVAASEFGRSK